MKSRSIISKHYTEIVKDQKEEVKSNELFKDLIEIERYKKPKTRAECLRMRRPCLFITCKYHLFLDVNPSTMSIKFNFPEKEIWDLNHTCALDIADKGGATLEKIGVAMNLTRERVRQIEMRAINKLKKNIKKRNITNSNDFDILTVLKAKLLKRIDR
ncbi:MAG TPA: sigma factor-like helix-turn-helix DNA-binding protein [bacterium]|jgi:hypothetical protein|nr:hypothetical protein [bacterium]MDX9805949.1 sigma factor-like helix-turn-helix DNA-binding protein [bacterium]HNW15103.1 sigma factor-like helix-turn-helix DNA-binding protein [bacterium]HNZ52538.1 sigma factor-like helix-turn-helix DNA-binding protein [bacterium]HOB70986.1 sigma factor-like helix-turn-helix DNA-binding protein [bacterium]